MVNGPQPMTGRGFGGKQVRRLVFEAETGVKNFKKYEIFRLFA